MITRFFHRRDWALVVVSIILILCQVWMDIKIPDYMSVITDSFLLNDTDVVVKYGMEMVACALASLALSIAVGFVLANVSASIGRNMRQDQFDCVQSFAVQDINRFSASSLITRSTNDVTQIQNFIARGLQITIKSPILAVWALGKIYGSSIEWTMVTVAALLVLVVTMSITLTLAKSKFKRIQWLTDGINRSTRENLDGMRVIRAYNAEDYQEKRFDDANRELLDNNISAMKYMAPGFPIAQSMMNFVTLGIYWVGAGLIMGVGDKTSQLLLFSDMIVFTSYATMVLSAFMQFFGIFRMLPRALVGIKRVEEVVDTKSSVTSGSVKEGKEGMKGVIEFENVSFSYPGSGKDTLRDLSFTVESGKTFAIIGSTGSGKSSMVNLMTRFYDATSGTVRIDGVDVRDYDIEALHMKIGYVPQSAIIFSGSVKDNVNFGAGSDTRSDEEIRRALRIAQADTFVGGMPEGWDSHISQHGRNVSGGQKQRISIARAVCRSPEIYILDDTFSALDYKTDKSLRESLRSETKGSTVVIVAQRIGTIMDADTILVLDEGRIVGRGTHRELLKECPLYQDIARSQLTEEELA